MIIKQITKLSYIWIFILILSTLAHMEWRQGQVDQATVDQVYKDNNDYMIMESKTILLISNAIEAGCKDYIDQKSNDKPTGI